MTTWNKVFTRNAHTQTHIPIYTPKKKKRRNEETHTVAVNHAGKEIVDGGIN